MSQVRRRSLVCHILLAGVLGTLHNTKNFELASGGVGPETTQALANIMFILEHVMGGGHNRGRSSSALNTIVKVNVYLRDSDRSAYTNMNEAYLGFFKKHSSVLDDGAGMPARMTSAAVTLALGAAVEIECVAVLP